MMRDAALAAPLPGGRLHLRHGPIDIVAGAFGTPRAVETAYAAAAERLPAILAELCAELTLLRAEARSRGPAPEGHVARRMARAVAPYAERAFITPMAAVAGAVAQEVLLAMTGSAPLARAYANNGGDIAFHLAPGERFAIGMVDRPDRPSLFGALTVEAAEPVRGAATSGWRGRSVSLGIACAVTVLARTAAEADAAATVIANAVDLPGHPAVARRAANEIAPDSDLGALLVTRGVGPLRVDEIDTALEAGACVARSLLGQGLVNAAALHLQGRTLVVGSPRARDARRGPRAAEPRRLEAHAHV